MEIFSVNFVKKMMLKEFKIHAKDYLPLDSFSKHLKQQNNTNPFLKPQNTIYLWKKFHRMTWRNLNISTSNDPFFHMMKTFNWIKNL